jgi:hypothetical protein
MKLFYIRAECHNGDADGPLNMDLFVHAENVATAVRLWEQHYDGWDNPDGRKVQVYDVSQTALCPSVMIWEHIPMVKWKVSL